MFSPSAFCTAEESILPTCSTAESSMPRRSFSRSFTMVELLAVVAVMAVLISGAIYFTASYIQWAKQTTAKEIYTVLNDELTRYKCGGGNISALTLGAPINDIFAALKTPVVPAGMPASFSQQFMANSYTYPGRSLQAVGVGSQYHFYQVDQYVGQVVPTGTPTSQYPYGYGYATGDGVHPYNFICGSSTNAIAVRSSTGSIAIFTGDTCVISWAPGPSLTFWSCQDGTHSTPAGNITLIEADCGGCGSSSGCLTSLNVSNLSGLVTLFCSGNTLTSINVSGCTNLSSLDCSGNQLTSLNLAGLSNLNNCDCHGNKLGPIYLGGHTPGTFNYLSQQSTYTPSLQ